MIVGFCLNPRQSSLLSNLINFHARFRYEKSGMGTYVLNDVETPQVDTGNTMGSETFRTQLGPLLLIASIFLLNFTARIIAAPLLPTIEKDLGFSHGDAGSLFLFLSMGYFISLLGSGHISSRITHKKTIAVSAIAVGTALSFISFSNSLFAMRCCVFVLGISAGIYLPSGITTVTSLVNPKHWGKAVAIHELAPNLSFILTPLLAEMLLHWFMWRNILFFIGMVSVVMGIVFSQFGKGGNFLGEAPNFSSIKKIFRIPAFWILMALFSLAITSTLGIYNMLPLYLVAEHGMSLDWANSLVGTSRISTLGMAFLGGWATDRFGPKSVMIGVFIVTGMLTLLIGMVSTYWIAAVVFLHLHQFRYRVTVPVGRRPGSALLCSGPCCSDDRQRNNCWVVLSAGPPSG